MKIEAASKLWPILTPPTGQSDGPHRPLKMSNLRIKMANSNRMKFNIDKFSISLMKKMNRYRRLE